MVEKRWRYFLYTPKGFKEGIAKGTSFLARARLVSPCEDMANLLDSHLTSQTGQVALERCRKLTGLDTLAGTAREIMGSYTAFLKTSADYLEVKSLQLGQWAFIIAVFAFLVTTSGPVVEFLGLILTLILGIV